jgi:dolichol-phosphate mannosyltransferase
MTIGIVIPCYNEEKNIFKLIKQLKNKIKRNHKIIIIDDSKDNLKIKIKKVIYIHRKKKLGRGSAVLLGLKNLLNEKKIKFFIEMDADFSHSPNEINNNLKIFNKKKLDLLISSRYLKKSKILNWPITRIILSRLSNILIRFLLKIPVNDFSNGFRIYSRRAVYKIIQKCGKTDSNFIILSEIIMMLYYDNFKISEIKTTFRNRVRGESSVNLYLILKSLYNLFQIFYLNKKLIKNQLNILYNK